jgi:hypothetical protein
MPPSPSRFRPRPPLRPIAHPRLAGPAGRLARIAVLVLALSLAGAMNDAHAGEFVPGIEDLPLMAELHAIEGSGFAFDTAAGRLVEAYAGGDVTREAVAEFYAQTLPALGWQADGERLWRREGETLAIEFVDGTDPLTVRFQLSPQ